MIDLGWVKAKRKDGKGWVNGYIFKFDKFGDGEELQYYVFRTGSNEESEIFMERPVERYEVYGETVCHYTTEKTKPDGVEIYLGDVLEGYGEKGNVVWSTDWTAFAVNLYNNKGGGDFLLTDFLESKIVGNVYDEFNLSKKEKKALKKKIEA